MTILNPTSTDSLVKRVEFVNEGTRSGVCGPPLITYVISDEVTIVDTEGDKIEFDVEFSSDSEGLSGYSFNAQGEFWDNGCYTDLRLAFDTSFLLPKQEYTSFFVNIPKQFGVSEEIDYMGDRATSQELKFIDVLFVKPDDPGEFTIYKLSLQVTTNNLGLISYSQNILE